MYMYVCIYIYISYIYIDIYLDTYSSVVYYRMVRIDMQVNRTHLPVHSAQSTTSQGFQRSSIKDYALNHIVILSMV